MGPQSQPVAQRLSLEQLHDGVDDRAVPSEVVDREDVRVRERGDRLRLALEARERLAVRDEALGQDLDRDVALEPRVPRPVDLAHAARAPIGERISYGPRRVPEVSAKAPAGYNAALGEEESSSVECQTRDPSTCGSAAR